MDISPIRARSTKQIPYSPQHVSQWHHGGTPHHHDNHHIIYYNKIINDINYQDQHIQQVSSHSRGHGKKQSKKKKKKKKKSFIGDGRKKAHQSATKHGQASPMRDTGFAVHPNMSHIDSDLDWESPMDQSLSSDLSMMSVLSTSISFDEENADHYQEVLDASRQYSLITQLNRPMADKVKSDNQSRHYNIESSTKQDNQDQVSTGSFDFSHDENDERSTSKSRYKTELCRSYAEIGVCRYGNKCQFAHGDHELRNVSRHQKYKSELCHNYHYEGQCLYGNRCCFIHSVSRNNVGLAVSQDWEILSFKKSGRLVVFNRLAGGFVPERAKKRCSGGSFALEQTQQATRKQQTKEPVIGWLH